MAPPILELRGVRAGYGRIEVLHGVDLVVPAGAIVGLLGPNGAGKTTTLAVISGQVAPSARIDPHGRRRRHRRASVDALARAGVCTIPEGRGIFPNLTVDENLWMFSHGGTSAAARRETAFEQLPAAAPSAGTCWPGASRAGSSRCSRSARALATDPALLLLDELSMGLAPMVVEELYEPGRRAHARRACRSSSSSSSRASCSRSPTRWP